MFFPVFVMFITCLVVILWGNFFYNSLKFPWVLKVTSYYQYNILAHLKYILYNFFQQGATIGIDDEDDSTFTITVDQKMFHFQGKYTLPTDFILTVN